MRVHQIITGSCNGGYSHIGQAKVRESNYIVYASGCDVVILNESFCRSQVISGCELGNSVITAVAFNHHYGKIAVANADGIFIYEPQATTESVLTNSSKLFWLFSSHLSLPSRSQVICLSWSHRPCFQFSNCGLLAGLDDGSLFMWRLSIKNNIADLSTRRFQVGPSLINSEKSLGTDLVPKESLSELQSKWKIAWCHRLNGTPLQIDFSPDGSYFASITKCDDKRSSCKGHKFYNEMHVWFRDPCFELSQSRNSYDSEQFRMTENWESILLPHPCNVCSFSWRHSSRYLPSGWMPNVLLTAGEDNLCRVWIEVSHPTINNSTTSSLSKQFSKDDSAVPMSSTVIKLYLPLGLTDVQSKQQKEAANDLTNESGESSTQYLTLDLPDCFLTHPLLRHFLDLWLTDPLSKIEVDYGSNAPLFPMKLDGKMYEFMQNSYPQFTFTTSLPLDCFPEISNISSLNDAQIGQLTVHWFNNKEYHLNAQLESFLMDTVSRILAIPVQIAFDNVPSNNSMTPELLDQIALMDHTVFRLLSELQHAPDVVFAIHPHDGSLIVWYIHGLDLSVPNPKAIRTQKVIIPHESSHRDKKFSCEAAFTLIPNLKSRLTQVTYSIRSRLHQAIPLDAANSLSSRLFTYLTTDFSKNPVNYFNYETTTSKHHHQQQQFLSDTTKNQPTETSSYLMTINYQDNLDIFCHLFLLKYSIRQCIMQWLKGPMNHFVVNNSKKHLEQFKQTILKPMLSSLAQIHLNSTTLGSRNQNSSHVAMITMHTNGSLRYWRIDVSESSHFQWIVSVSGCARLSGHRFHTNTIVPHPILPLALSTSHYEYKLERSKFNCGSTSRHLMHPHSTMNQDMKITNYSEVILWYVSSVGPLSTGYTSSLLSSYQFRCSQHTVSADSQLFSNNPLTASDINGCGNISSHGGISEVARLILSNNCSNISSNTTPLTFRHIAWFPCMITTVATSYPVALFVASLDGANHSGKDNNEPGEDQLGLFLTFSKLKQINKSVVNGKKQKNNSHLLHSSMNSDTLGCIIQLDYKLSLSSQIFKNYENFHADTLVLHVFPSELIVSNSEISKPTMNLTTSTSTTTDPIQSSTTQSDISPLSAFLIVRLTRYTLNELVNSSSVETSCIQTDFCRMEMWQVRISTSTKYCNIVDGISVKSSVTDKFEPSIDNLAIFNSMLSDAIKVCDCKLSLPPGVSIVCAQVSAAHVSWAALSTFNAPPPYLIVSACSDGCLRFWRCQLCSINSGGCNHPTPDGVHDQFTWEEWRMPLMQSMSSCIELQLATDNNANKNCINDSELVRPIILGLDCAYSGRLAVAYTQFYNRIINDTMDERSHLDLSLMKDANNQLTVYVTIYECESSGGCEWILEDTIELTSETYFLENSIDKLSIQLDWVNTEDGGHLLSVIIDSEVFVFAPFCQNLTLSHNKLRRGVHPSCQPTLMTTIGEVYIGWKPIACTRIFTADFTSSLSSLASVKKKELSPASQHQHQWYSSNHNVHTTTPSSPNQGYKQAAWLRDGLLLISAKTEMQLFSQWPSDNLFNLLKWHVKPKMHIVESPWNSSSSANESFDAQTTVMEPDADDSTVSGSSSMSVARLTKAYSPYPLKPSHSSSLLHTTSHSDLHATTTVSDTGTKSQVMMTSQFSQIDLNRAINGGLCVKSNEQLSKDVELLSNLGLFEAIQIVNPILPQFHPRQLLEWMNLGHLRRIKAILAHLTRCLSAVDNSSQQQSYSQSSGSDHRRMTKGNLNSELANFVIESYDATMTTNNPTGKSLRSSSISHSLHSSSPPSNLLETHAIPPLPLYVLLAVDSLQMTDVAADMESRKHFDPISDWNDEHGLIDESKYFEIQDDDLNLTYTDNNEDKNNNTDKRNVSKRIRPSNLPFNSTIHNTPSHLCGFSIWSLKPASLARSIQFSEDDARLLSDYLSTQKLPGLSSLDQMYLLGIADLMAKTHSNITDCLSEVNSSTNEKKLPRQTSMKQDSKEDLDECGLRFLLTVQLYSYLSKTLPPARRSQLLSSGLTNSSLVWAYHSDSEEELLAQLPIAYNQSGGCSGGSAVSSDLNWSDFKRYGCGWWIRSESLLIRCAEKMARTAFQNTKDPMEAAVFYLAMHKAKMVAALFKTTGNKILENFFRSDFTPGQPACRQAKLNAFRLLSQHKYLQAAGLFLLAGCLDDAVRVCLDTLKDLQMGIVLVRLYTSSALGVSSQPSSAISEYHAFLKNHVVKHDDPFLRSMAHWTLGDPLAALETLLEGPGTVNDSEDLQKSETKNSLTNSFYQSPQHPQYLSGSQGPGICGTTSTPSSVCPSVFKFYTYLQSHPLVLRHQRLQTPSLNNSSILYRVKSLERRLYFRTAHHYFVLGCPTLALEVLTKLPRLQSFNSSGSSTFNISTNDESLKSYRQSELRMDIMKSTNTQNGSTLNIYDDGIFTLLTNDDRSQKYEVSKTQDQFTIEWSDEDDGADNDNEKKDIIDKKKSSTFCADREQPGESQQRPSLHSEDNFNVGSQGEVDLMANQLKFIACLKILAEELSTLAAGAESEGVSLRQHVWQWLENELAIVNTLTRINKSTSSTSATSVMNNFPTINAAEKLNECNPDYSEFSGPLTTTSYLLTTKNVGSVLTGIFVNLSSVSPEIRDAELKRLKTRYDWIKAHETFLISLINFCDLYGSSGIRLPAVRIELSLLLNELYSSSYLFTCQSKVPLHNNHLYKSDSNLVATRVGGGNVGHPSLDSCWPISTMALIDSIPLLRTLLRLPSGALLLPDSVKRIKYMVHDLITCLELLPPPFLASILLPYPYQHNRHCATTTKSKSLYNDALKKSSSLFHCANCILAPTADRHRRVFLLRNLCAALSACIHQCLSVGGWLGLGYTIDENSVQSNPSSLSRKVFALPATSTVNIRSVDRLCVSDQTFRPNTEPSKWPGLTCLKNYTDPQLQSNSISTSQIIRITSTQSLQDCDSPPSSTVTRIQSVDRRRFIGLLAQALAASYFGLLIYALHTRDACTLYRLACARLDAKTWNRVFGGTYRAKPFRPPTQPGSNTTTTNISFGLMSDKKTILQKPPTRPKQPSLVNKQQDRSKSRSPEKNVTRASDRAAAALEVASKIGSPPITSVLTSQHIRFLAHAEASAIADTTRSDVVEQKMSAVTMSQSSISPEEWFIFAQSSILSCLLERPVKYTDVIDDPSEIFDSDASEPSPNDEYNTYHTALFKQRRRVNRIQRFIKHCHALKQRKTVHHRMKHSLHYRLTGQLVNNNNNNRDHSDEVDDTDGDVNDDDEQKVNDNLEDSDDYYDHLDVQHPTEVNNETPNEVKDESGKLSSPTKLNLSNLQPQWILRRLHLNPDFIDTWWGSQLESEFYEALEILHARSDKRQTTHTNLKDYPEFNSTAGYLNDANDTNDNEEEEVDEDDDYNLTVDALGNRKLAFFENDRQWAYSDSYAWRLIRLGLMQLAKRELNRLIQIIDFNGEDLAVYGPGLVTLIRLVDCWLTGYRSELSSPPALNPIQLKLKHKGLFMNDEHLIPPKDFLPDIQEDLSSSSASQTATMKGISNLGTVTSGETTKLDLPSAGATRSMLRLKKLINVKNTPFQTRDPFSLPVKRLWCYLVRQPDLDDTFLRHIFRKPYLVQSVITPNIKFSLSSLSTTSGPPELITTPGLAKSTSSSNLKNISSTTLTDIQKSSGKQTRTHQQTQSTNQTAGSSLLLNDAVRLIHKEHDPLIAMCINQVNFSAIAIATPKEIIELDIGNLVNLPPWFADEIEYDLELMRRPQTRRYPEGGTDDFIVCDTTKNSIKVATNDPSDVMTSNNITSSSTVASMSASDNNPSGSGTHVILKRTLPAVYSLTSHPTMPYYLCGTGTGSVHMFEWSTPVPVVAGFTNTYSLTAAACMSGQFPAGSRGARVTALQFDDSGYRFGCGDADGNFGLWNLYSTMPGKLPYFRCRCHAKGLADFCFLGCSSLIVTVGNGGITTTASTSFVSGVEGGFGGTGSAGTGVNYGSSGPTHYTSTSIIGSGSSSSYSSGNVSVDQDASHLTLWDTLLPSNRCGVIRVLDPELDAPCTSIAYCGSLTSINSWPRNTDIYSLNNMIYSYTSTITPTTTNSGRFFTGSGGDSDRTVIVGTKNGDICTVDMRNPKVLHKFSAHDSPIRTLCIDSATNCLVTGGADGIVKIWRLSEQELLTSFCGDLHPSRGAAAVAAAALFRGNQPAAIIAATNPGISNIRLLPTVTGAALLHVNTNNDSNLLKDDSSTNLGTSAPTHFLHDQKSSMTTASTACRFLSCGADGGLRMRSLVVRPKPFMVC
ncbi:DmX-like protein isoform 1 [Schistosoma japonicum]|uniref:DmX-like protein isoform 1 n=2 Tax=Schistosoma japonicum TaxID=6182 RepID=A0A4Z2CQ30_SCHJA|nr:DmX-like protein isoform 1 [Schistosoma japonicum]TNN06364.1 DmX-like protein isoform 1 [Schistosoma japonicum]